MSEIIPNSYSLQVNWDEKYAVTLCARPGCGAELRTKKLYVQRDTVQREHDREFHFFTVTRVVDKTTYALSGITDDPEMGRVELESNFSAELAILRKHTKYPSTTFVKNSRKPWKRPADKKELYEPTGLMVGATVEFRSQMTTLEISPWPDYKSRIIDEKKFTGVVWSNGAVPNSVWILCEDGLCYLVSTKDLTVLWAKDPRGQESKEWQELIKETA